jgi:hypothetical protein
MKEEGRLKKGVCLSVLASKNFLEGKGIMIDCEEQLPGNGVLMEKRVVRE